MTEPVLTLFSTPKPFTDRHIAMIQRNSIQSWKQLGEKVVVVFIGEEEGVRAVARELDVRLIPDIRRNKKGTPLVSSIFESARSANTSPLLGYINSDVIVFSDFPEICKKTAEQADRFVLAGQRWDLKVERPIRFQMGWESTLKKDIEDRGRRHPPAGSDYFVFPRACYPSIPDFAIGRAGWDNWMIFKARWEHWKMIDASDAITVVHQDHDYSHLPNGIIHHRQVETLENIKIMGGRFAVYTLSDANYYLKNNRILPRKINRSRLIREISLFPSVSLKSPLLGKLFYFLFNPQKVKRDIQKDKNIKAHNP